MTRGLFITLEGGEGSGKTTQIGLLAEAMNKAGYPSILTREPGGTDSAEKIRELLVTGAADRWDAISETLLFQAARVEHVQRLILPALTAGKSVICDRFLDSTRVYQGIGKGLSSEWVKRLHAMTLGNLQPDLTLMLDIAVETGMKRAAARKGNETRFEGMATAFHESVRQGFLDIAKAEPGRCVVVNAAQSVEAVHQTIWGAVEARL